MAGVYENSDCNGPGTYITGNGDAYQGVSVAGKHEGLVLVNKADGAQSVETWEYGEKQK